MTSQHERTRPAAFLSDERCIGGAHCLMSDYVNHYRRLSNAKPTRAILEANKTTWQTTAQQLSTNKAARQAALNTTHMEHVNNVYHMNQRIENSYSVTERRKNPYDATMFPAQQKRQSNLFKSNLHRYLMAWVPGTGRPQSAPSARSRKVPHGLGDGYKGWSITKDLRDAFYGDDFPLDASYIQIQKDSVYVAYKRAMMEEIIENRMFREADLKRLFKSYIKLAPLRDKDAVDKVVADLRVELDVRGAL